MTYKDFIIIVSAVIVSVLILAAIGIGGFKWYKKIMAEREFRRFVSADLKKMMHQEKNEIEFNFITQKPNNKT